MNKKIIGIIMGIAAAALIAVGVIRAMGSGGSAVSVEVFKIDKGDLSSYISADGVIEEVEKSEVYFDTPLKVAKVMIEEGQRVKKGERLLELDMDALGSQLETLKINRSTQQISLDSKALDAEVQRAENNLKAAERYYNDAKKTYEDNKALYEAHAISKAELDMSEKAFIDAESGISGLKNARLAYNAAIESRSNTKKSTEESIKVTDIQIADLEKKINDINALCLASMDGVIASVSIQEGAFTSSMQPAYKIIDPEKLQIRARINEYDVKSVAPGQDVRITGDAIDKGIEVTGSVKSISPVAVTTMTANGNETVVEILISVDGAGNVLKPGLNVTCDIAVIDKSGILLAPMEAITPDKDDNMMVFVVDEDTNRITQRTVSVGINSDMNVEILEGLSEGEIVVLDPQPSYSDGMSVKIKK
ncbi:MAG: HlyD family efflux transporter periplasmic adaptor subunit [Clostridiaceae bacterium]|jgi:RND family efflux transporter MFP subunit|nr:HlyD family efflux transporter periplasmic adaptor subunit [Clostridiaceae bacterium]